MCRTDIIAHMQAIADNPLACTVLALQVEARVRIRDAHPVQRFEGGAGRNMLLGAILLINDGLIASDSERRHRPPPPASTSETAEQADAAAMAQKLAPANDALRLTKARED